MLKFRWPKRATPNPLPESRPPEPAALGGYALLFGDRGTSAPALQAAREPIVFIGNCIAETVAYGLAATPEVTKHFSPVPVPLHLRQIDSPDVVQAVSDARFVFIQGLALRHMDHIQTPVRSHCQIVNVPDFVLYSAWPFDGHNGYRDPAVTATLPQAAAHQHDGALARLREIEPDKGKRLRRYRDLDFDLASRIDRVIETQNRFLVDMDKGNDAQMGRFIARHFRDRPLFYNCAHPSEILFQELCEFCWTKLDLRGAPPRIPGLDAWKGWRVPVHPRIAERVGLTWANERTRYAYGTLGSVTWDEWARHYIETYG